MSEGIARDVFKNENLFGGEAETGVLTNIIANKRLDNDKEISNFFISINLIIFLSKR